MRDSVSTSSIEEPRLGRPADERARRGSGAEAEADAGTTPSAAMTQAPSLVLIADDEEPFAETLALIVSGAGYTPLLAAHGKHTLELRRPTGRCWSSPM